MTDSPELIIVGRVRRAHGIRGELVVEITTDEPDAVFASGRRLFVGDAAGTVLRAHTEARVTRTSPFKGGLIVKLEGIEDRNAAETWRERTFLVPQDELTPPDENEVYVQDLVGMRVELLDGTLVGSVADVFELPQGLALEVAREGRASSIVPFHETAVHDVDRDARLIRLDPVPGLLD